MEMWVYLIFLVIVFTVLAVFVSLWFWIAFVV